MRRAGALREQVSAAPLSRWLGARPSSRAHVDVHRRRVPSRPRASHASRLLSGASARGGGSPATVAALGARGFAFRESIATDGSRRRLRRASRVRAAARRGRERAPSSRLRGDARARRRVPRGPEPGGGSGGRREHGGVHVRHRDASARPDVARRRQRVVPGRGVARRVRRGRLRAGVPVLRVRQRGDEDQAGAEAAGGHRGGQRRPKGGRVRVGKRRRRRRLRARRARGLPSRARPVPAGLRRVFLLQARATRPPAKWARRTGKPRTCPRRRSRACPAARRAR